MGECVEVGAGVDADVETNGCWAATRGLGVRGAWCTWRDARMARPMARRVDLPRRLLGAPAVAWGVELPPELALAVALALALALKLVPALMLGLTPALAGVEEGAVGRLLIPFSGRPEPS